MRGSASNIYMDREAKEPVYKSYQTGPILFHTKYIFLFPFF